MRHRSSLLCLVAAVAALSLARPAFLFAGGGGIKEGDPAPMFSGLTIDNQKIDFRIVFDELAADAFTVADPYGVAGTGEQLKAEIEKIAK